MKSLEIGIPIAWYDKRITTILEQDANAKYINYVEEQPLDDGNKSGHPFPFNPNIPDEPQPDVCPRCGDKPCHC